MGCEYGIEKYLSSRNNFMAGAAGKATLVIIVRSGNLGKRTDFSGLTLNYWRNTQQRTYAWQQRNEHKPHIIHELQAAGNMHWVSWAAGV